MGLLLKSQKAVSVCLESKQLLPYYLAHDYASKYGNAVYGSPAWFESQYPLLKSKKKDIEPMLCCFSVHFIQRGKR